MAVDGNPVKSETEAAVVRRPASRTATLDRDAVVDAAVALVAREGFAALSMRRVAAELGVGTMTLYWHVETREDLIELMVDRKIVDQLLPSVPTDWREALTAIARATRAAFTANLWMKDAPFGKRFGVGVLEHVEQSMAAVENMALPFAHRMAAISIVDTFVRGWVLDHTREPDIQLTPPPLTDDAALRLAAGEFPRYAQIVEQDWAAADWAAAQGFEVGLAIVLDGIEAAVARGRMPGMPPTDAPAA